MAQSRYHYILYICIFMWNVCLHTVFKFKVFDRAATRENGRTARLSCVAALSWWLVPYLCIHIVEILWYVSIFGIKQSNKVIRVCLLTLFYCCTEYVRVVHLSQFGLLILGVSVMNWQEFVYNFRNYYLHKYIVTYINVYSIKASV